MSRKHIHGGGEAMRYSNYVEEIRNTFSSHTNIENSIRMKGYMKGKFEFFGIKAPLRKKLIGNIIRKYGVPQNSSFNKVILELWAQPERELQCVALDLIEHKGQIDINLIERLIMMKSWWDTVDHLAIRQVGTYLKENSDKIRDLTEPWISSDNIWLKRSALLFQLKYKENTDVKLLFEYIRRCANTKEFFVNKAIGWSLRQYSRIDPESVIKFINENQLSKLSIREGLKHIKKTSPEKVI